MGAGVSIATFLIAGCAGGTGANGLKPSQDASVRPGDAWSGRLALQVDGAEAQSFSASFELKGRPDAGELILLNPLGGTIALLQWSPGIATLRTGQDQRRFGSLEALAAEATGTPIPVAALFDWLAGTPSPVPGWEPDLRQQAQGRIVARRTAPLPAAVLRVILDR